jgi:hypothetical protein
LAWLRQEENQYLSTPPLEARELSSDLQQLIGYSMAQYALGYYTPPGGPDESTDIADPQDAVRSPSGAFQTVGSPESLQNLEKQIGGKLRT